MSEYITLLQNIIRCIGTYVKQNPEYTIFPEHIIADCREQYHIFWKEGFSREIDKWRQPGLKGLCFGTIIGRDLSHYVHAFGAIFDKILIREPLGKVLLLAPYKTPQGLFEELVSYLGVMISIEPWIDQDIVCVYPPFYLFDHDLKNNIVATVENCLDNNDIKEIALTCPDRTLSHQKMLDKYQDIFLHLFDPYYIDLSGGIHRFTEDYIVRTIVQDVVTAQYLSIDTKSVLVTDLERHARLLCYLNTVQEGTELMLPAGLGKCDPLVLRNASNFINLRQYLWSFIADRKELARLHREVEEITKASPVFEKEKVLLYTLASSIHGNIHFLKAPFDYRTEKMC